MHILLFSEGNSDARLGFHQEARGAVLHLLEKLLISYLGLHPSAIVIEGDRLPRVRGGFDRKVQAAIDEKDGKVDALAIVIDRGEPRNRERLQLLRKGRDSSTAGLASKTAVGIAIWEMEAWLLADTAALSAVLNAKGASPSPEEIEDPKAELERLARSSGLSVSEYYDQIAKSAELETIKKHCRAFEEFANEVKHRICA